MLSINIPVYNVDVQKLVTEAERQAVGAGIDFEIRVYDDGSDGQFLHANRKLRDLEHVVYVELPENMGRSAIRNKMGFDSQKQYLLFIDADSLIDSDNYLLNYIKAAYAGCIISGGTKYMDRKPEDPEKLLRWVYGRNREAIPAKDRYKQKGFVITSNNFLIDNEVFRKIHFREEIGPYGHEDTLLGYDLFTNNYVPHHIDNPVVHAGLESSSVFLEKTQKALENLLFIDQEVVGNDSRFREKVRFLNLFDRLSGYFPETLIGLSFRILKSFLRKNLTGRNPNLTLFDIYKVGYYATFKQSKYKPKKSVTK